MAGVDWIDVAEDRDRWRAFVDAVMNFPQSASQEVFCSMKQVSKLKMLLCTLG